MPTHVLVYGDYISHLVLRICLAKVARTNDKNVRTYKEIDKTVDLLRVHFT